MPRLGHNVLANHRRDIPDMDEVPKPLKQLQVNECRRASNGALYSLIDERDFIGRQGINLVEILCRWVRFQAGKRGLVELGHVGSIPMSAGGRVTADRLQEALTGIGNTMEFVEQGVEVLVQGVG